MPERTSARPFQRSGPIAVVAIGECMVEMALVPGAAAQIAFAGDTFNTAVYLSRLGLAVDYATAVGLGDPFSAGILERMAQEGIGAGLAAQVPGRLPGLYAIERDAAGERRFFYWRGEAAVRDLFAVSDVAALGRAMRAAGLVYLSGITLAVIGEAGRTRLAGLLAEAAAAGAAVAFDTNYRARLWADAATARAAIEAVVPHGAFVSASEEDLAELYAEGPAATVSRWAAGGAEVIARAAGTDVTVHGPDGAVAAPARPPVRVLDATGAGDSFNAAYLATRMQGGSVEAAVAAGRRLAQVVVQHLGAIIPATAMPISQAGEKGAG
jgi:2-dehydro-3-deoxygluconokinase